MKITLDLNTSLLRELLEEAETHGWSIDKTVMKRLNQPLPLPTPMLENEDDEDEPETKPHYRDEPLVIAARYKRNVDAGVAVLARRYSAILNNGKIELADLLYLLNFVEPYVFFTYTQFIGALPARIRELVTPDQYKGWTKWFYNRAKKVKGIRCRKPIGTPIEYWAVARK